jgi:hypothetical protein
MVIWYDRVASQIITEYTKIVMALAPKPALLLPFYNAERK